MADLNSTLTSEPKYLVETDPINVLLGLLNNFNERIKESLRMDKQNRKRQEEQRERCLKKNMVRLQAQI